MVNAPPLRHTRMPLGASIAAAAALALAAASVALPSTLPVRELTTSVAVNALSPPVVAPEVAGALLEGPATVIVRVDAGGHDAALATLDGTHATLVHDLPLIGGFVAEVDTVGLGALLDVSAVRSIVLDGVVELAQEPTAPLEVAAPNSNFVETIGADALHAQGFDGTGVGIAILDTGVTEVTDLAGRLVGGIDLSDDVDATDKIGHGTFIAGIAAGNGSASGGDHAGVAPGASIIPIKIAGAAGTADISHVMAGIQYAIHYQDELGIDVLNLSLGTDSVQPNAISPLNYAVEQAWDAGLVVVVSGGNNGEEGAGRIPKPADDPLVITVGATDSNDTIDRSDDEVAPYSSRGPSIADRIVKPDIVAPGSYLVSTKAPGSMLDTNYPDAHIAGDYARGSGTSFAAGAVSGAAALLVQAHPEWDNDQVKQALLTSAAPGPVGDPNVDGFGALAVDMAVSATPTAGNQDNIVRSTGTGTMEGARGSDGVRAFYALLVDQAPPVHLAELATDAGVGQGQVDRIARGELPGLGQMRKVRDFLGQVASTSEVDAQKAGWYNAGWYNAGWYNAGWYNAGWYNAGWYNAGWYNAGWYNAGWYNAGWYNAGWYNAGWYNAGWYNAGWYNAGWYNAGWYNAGWYNAGWY